MSVALNKKVNFTSAQIIKLLVTFGIPVIIFLIPTNEIFTSPIRTTLAATFGLLAWAAFELTDLSVPSMLYPCVLYFGGAVSFEVAYAPFLSTMVIGVLACLAFANILDRINLLKRISYWIAIKVGGSFAGVVYSMFFACFIVNVLTFGNGDPLAAALVFGVCKAFNIIKKKEGAVVMMAGMLGFATTKAFYYYPVFMQTMKGSVTAVEPNFSGITMLDLFKYNWPVLVYLLIFIALMLKFCVSKEMKSASDKEYFIAEYEKLGKISRDEIFGIIATSFMMLWILTEPFTHFDMMSGFIIGIAILFLPGINIGRTQDINNVGYGIILFFATCMSIGAVCVKVGIVSILGDALLGLLAGFSPILSLFMVFLSGIFLNFCMTPMAMFGGFSGLYYQLAGGLGIDPRAVLFAFNYSTDTVFLPYEYLTFLIFFAFGGMTMGQFVKFHSAKILGMLIFFGLIIIPYWYLVGLL